MGKRLTIIFNREDKIMDIKIKNRFTNEIIIEGKYKSVKDCLEKNKNANLKNAYLSNAYLKNANLSNAYLKNANLSNSYLKNADLENAYLKNADLENADLENADFKNANLENADFKNANLSYANLENADLENANLFRADLENANFKNANLFRADLENANLSGADLSGANLSGADLENIKNYSQVHEVAIEIIRGQKIETFTEKEWSIIAQISLHRLCWDSIKKRYGNLKSILHVFKILSELGFPEYYEKFKKQ